MTTPYSSNPLLTRAAEGNGFMDAHTVNKTNLSNYIRDTMGIDYRDRAAHAGGIQENQAQEIYRQAGNLGLGAGDIDSIFGWNNDATNEWISARGLDPLNTTMNTGGGSTPSPGAAPSPHPTSPNRGGQAPAPGSQSPATGTGRQRPTPGDYTGFMSEWSPTTRQVTPQETVAGQMESLLDSNNPYIDRARGRASDYMNSRGFVNSTMAAQAGETAAIDAALPIAQQDALTHAEQGRANQGFMNQSGQFNAQSNNALGQTDFANQLSQDNMRLEADIRERLAAVDQQYALQLETLSQEYSILENYQTQAGTMYADSIRTLSTVLSNPDLTPEQQQAGARDIMESLQAGLVFLQGISGQGGTGAPNVPDIGQGGNAGNPSNGGSTPPAPVTEVQAGQPGYVAGMNNATSEGLFVNDQGQTTFETVSDRYGQGFMLATYSNSSGNFNEIGSILTPVRMDPRGNNIPTVFQTNDGSAVFRASGWDGVELSRPQATGTEGSRKLKLEMVSLNGEPPTGHTEYWVYYENSSSPQVQSPVNAPWNLTINEPIGE